MSKGNKLVIFIVKNRALGDSIMGLSSVQFLKETYPDAYIIYAVPKWVAPLYVNVKSAADEIYPISLKNGDDVISLWSDLLEIGPDMIIELQQTGRGNKFFKCFSFFNKAKYYYHNHHAGHKSYPLGIKNLGIPGPLIQRDLNGLAPIFLRDGNYLDYEPKLKCNFAIAIQKEKIIILGVVATRPAKMWPLDLYLELALKLAVNYQIIIPLSRSEGDMKIYEAIKDKLSDKIKVVFEKLENLPQLFHKAMLYIGNDTGQKHLAVALSLPTLTLFGPEPILEWHPYSIDHHRYLFINDLPCRIVTHHYCGLYKCNLENEHYHKCMKMISVNDVLEAVDDLSASLGQRQNS